MQVIYLPQETRFNVRLTEAACARLPEGTFSTTTSAPVYAMRIDGERDATDTHFLLPAADNELRWIAMSDTRLARR